MNIYVGNLDWHYSEEELQELFEAYGQVTSASIIKDKMSGRSRGFGFVEMPSEAEAQAAITALNGKNVGGRDLVVNVARPREERPPRSGGGDFRQQRGGGGGGRRQGDKDRNRGQRGRGRDDRGW